MLEISLLQIINIINSSIDKEIFPDSWKVARTCPVPKIDNPINEKAFRPISILTVSSKIYRKVILKQLSDYIERTSIYNSTQSSFRKGHSTQAILLKFRNDIQKALNKNETTMSVFIDYSKALDAIQHETLIKKLANLNFSNSSIKIILNYLSNIQQYVQLDDKKSSYRPIYFGVPQGSILHPVLFNIYVSSLPSCLKSNSIQYADETSLYLSNSIRNIQSTMSILETDI